MDAKIAVTAAFIGSTKATIAIATIATSNAYSIALAPLSPRLSLVKPAFEKMFNSILLKKSVY